MRRGWAAIASATGGVLLLVSLYLPWWSISCASSDAQDRLFCGRLSLDAWSTGNGSAAALASLALLAALAFGLAAEAVAGLGVLAAYLGLAVGVETRAAARFRTINGSHFHAHAAAGAHFAVVATALLAVGAAATVSGPRPGARAVPGIALASALLVALLLPWTRLSAARGHGLGSLSFEWPGISVTPATAAAALAVCVVAVWWQRDPAARPYRLELAVATAILAGGAVAIAAPPYTASGLTFARLGGAWLALGCAIALVGVALPVPLPTPSRLAAATVAAGALFVVSLFLTWQESCSVGLGIDFGGCSTAAGWTFPTTTPAALLALALVFAVLETGALPPLAAEAAVGIALLVASAGFESASGEGTTARYGAWIGFAGAAALVVLALTRIRVTWPGGRRALELAAPLAACLGYLFVLFVASWHVFPGSADSAVEFGAFGWLSVGGALLAILLLGRWLRGFTDWLVLIPLGMLALAALELVALRHQGMTWGDGAVVALCLVLAALGRIRQRGLPELLRIDRI